jgi:chemosensory pili system protein ChpA (sensor histidine kinase/response regulator)
MNMHSNELFDAFVFDVHEALGTFEHAANHLRHSYDKETIKDLSVIAHRIRGTAALYNYPQVSRLAELIERLMEYGERIPKAQLPKLLHFLEQVTVCLRGGVEGITERGHEGSVGLQLTALGASKLFRELLQEAPEAFVNRQVVSTQESLGQDVNIALQLRHFYESNKDSWEFFAPEAREHLDIIEATLEETQDAVTKAHINQLFRSTHTLKGAAYMIDCKPVGDLSHRLEDVMEMVRDDQREFDDDLRKLLYQGQQVLRLMLESAEGKDVEVMQPYAQVNGLLRNLLGQSSSLVNALRQFRKTQTETWDYFAPEVQEHLETFQKAFQGMQQASSEEHLTNLLRSVHTIKGASYTVGFQLLGDVAKKVELIARGLREEDLVFAEVSEVLNLGYQTLCQMMACAGGDEVDIDQSLEQFNTAFLPLGLLETVKTKSKTLELKGNTIRVGLNKIDGLMNLANEMVMTRARLEDQLERFESMTQLLEFSRVRMLKTTTEFEDKYLNPRLQAQTMVKASSENKESGVRTSLASTFDELEFDSYSDLNILARSISEMSSDLNEVQLQLNRFRRDFSQELTLVERLSRRLRNEVSRTRLLPVSQLFNRLKRLLKESDDKTYQLDLRGEMVEMDAAILEAISDPMIHLVKNAIVHGIEDKDQRLGLGKSAEGKITLNAYPQGNNVVIEVSDDGAGINIEAVKTQAVLRGLRSSEEVASLSDQEALNLIFLAGLSTAAKVTADAGRGVGMDAVASSLRQLGGNISISSQLGQGSRFTLTLPLTLLVSEALMVGVGGQVMAFPINTVKTLRYIPLQQLTGDKVTIAERLLPLYRAQELLGFPLPQKSELAVVVLETNQGEIALSVDEFINIEEISMRSLGQTLKGLGHLAGATFSSQGQVILLLDPNGLMALSPQTQVSTESLSSPQTVTRYLRVLLVDDSISVRKVLTKMLESHDYQVIAAKDGQDALDILRTQSFDVVLTDLEMPRLNGYELIEDVRRRFRIEELPILVMTTRAGDKHRQLALELGANQYFSKPIDENKLLNFLRSLKPQGASLNL